MISYKKAQVTIFFLLGVVLLISFMLLLMAGQEINTVQEVEEAPTTQESRTFFAECIDETFLPAITNISRNGGVLNLDQQAVNDYYTYKIDGAEYKHYYGIKHGNKYPSITRIAEDKLGGQSNSDEFYNKWHNPQPLQTGLNIYASLNLNNPWDAFGKVTLPKLCKSTNTDCIPLARGTPSIEEELESYMEGQIANCRDAHPEITAFLDISEEQLENPDVKVIFGEANTQVSLTFYSEQEPIRRAYPLRLLPLYNYIFHFLYFETQSPYNDWHSENSIKGSTYYKDDYTIEIINGTDITNEDPTDLNGNHIINITDTGTEFNGKPFYITFAVENRGFFLERASYPGPGEIPEYVQVDPDIANSPPNNGVYPYNSLVMWGQNHIGVGPLGVNIWTVTPDFSDPSTPQYGTRYTATRTITELSSNPGVYSGTVTINPPSGSTRSGVTASFIPPYTQSYAADLTTGSSSISLDCDEWSDGTKHMVTYSSPLDSNITFSSIDASTLYFTNAAVSRTVIEAEIASLPPDEGPLNNCPVECLLDCSSGNSCEGDCATTAGCSMDPDCSTASP